MRSAHLSYTLPFLLIMAACASSPPPPPPQQESPSEPIRSDEPQPPLATEEPVVETEVEKAPETSVLELQWTPPEGPAAAAQPTALERRRLAAYAHALTIAPVEVEVRLPEYPVRVAGILQESFDKIDSSAAEYLWRVMVRGETQPSEQNYYGRVLVRVAVADALAGREVSHREFTGPWTLSRVSVADAHMNSLQRLVEDTDLEVSSRQSLAASFAQGVHLAIDIAPDTTTDDTAALAEVLRQIAFGVRPRTEGFLVVSHLPPDLFHRRLVGLLNGSPFIVSSELVERRFAIGYTPE